MRVKFKIFIDIGILWSGGRRVLFIFLYCSGIFKFRVNEISLKYFEFCCVFF